MTTAVKTERAIFASGCFWGTEYYFEKVKGVISTSVGYTGGHTDNATYPEVCTGTTGHAEAVEVTFDPSLTSYEELAKLFFETHNPGYLNRQGLDFASQYRSAVFYMDDEQKEIIEKLIETLRQKGHKVVTQVAKADTFWKAEDRHQHYYTKGVGNSYCHSYTKKF